MSAALIDGKELSKKIKAEIRNRTENIFKGRGIRPGLAVVTAGEDPASLLYIGNIEKQCKNTGINFYWHKLDVDVTEYKIIETINKLNGDKGIAGIIVQLPLPEGVDARKIGKNISPNKDVDCFNPVNAGRFFLGEKAMLPCTPKGIIRLIEESGIPTAGRKAVVVGRSNIVGKPVALLLLKKNCTVTICHSKTKNLKRELLSADIIVAATGRPALITGDMISGGTAVIDAGVSMIDSKPVGDVVYEEARKNAAFITPVPGGVGPMTTAMLLENTLEAFENAHEDLICN